MKRTWLLAFLFLTLWQMLPHEGYNMLYAQDMGDESYGGGYECEDDFGHYYSSVPCDDTPCFEKCTICGGQFTCNEFKGHSCEDKNKTHCPYCDQFLTQEEFLYHNCSTQDMGCLICGRPYEDCTCEGPIISPTNPYVTPSNPQVTPGDSIVVIYYPPSNETHTDGSGSNSNNNTQEDDTEENDSDVTAGERYWEDKTNCISPNTLKFMTDVKTIDYLPDSFVPQGSFPDCVARAFATSIYLLSKGDLSQYELAYSLALTEAYFKGANLAADGIDPRKFDNVLGDAFDIQTLSPDEYTKDTIFNYINNNKPVISSMDTDYSIPLRQKGVHAVTIVAYDLQFYYCAYGGNDVVKIPHSEIGKYPIYVTTGLK